MGCFMNILWLMFGGIITAVENGKPCLVAFRQRGS